MLNKTLWWTNSSQKQKKKKRKLMNLATISTSTSKYVQDATLKPLSAAQRGHQFLCTISLCSTESVSYDVT